MRLIFIYIIFSVLTSCFPSNARNLDKRDSYLYNKVGFQEGERPADIERQNSYYPSSVQRQPIQRPQFQRPPQRQYQQNSAASQYPPASRYYKNPYSLKPPQQYPYYDSDEYYVLPQGGQMNQDYQRQGPQNNSSGGQYQEQLY